MLYKVYFITYIHKINTVRLKLGSR